MAQYLSLAACLGALALAGSLVPGHTESGGSDSTALFLDDIGAHLVGEGGATPTLADTDAPPALEAEPPLMALGLRVVPRDLEHELAALMPCEEWLPRTGVGSFRPYPECAAVGMPFAGVKMCGEGLAAAAR
jgi:hypothetical protein